MPSDDIAISVHNVSKTYRLFGHPGDRVRQFLSLGLKRYHREFPALQHVTFDVRKGETFGIIGPNGSGKSTLLQIICGIMRPSEGTVTVNGRISALLELGAGFNPEFTGRENVYFQGSIIGLTRDEMDRRFASIASFADIGDFLDQPVRTYSSGMFVRLAFSVAIHVAPSILAVDEALAVGDSGFRARCYRRIGELRTQGVTILFVSHDLEQVARLCGRAILLDEGQVLAAGEPAMVTDFYVRLMNASPERRSRVIEHIKSQSPEAGGPIEDVPDPAFDEMGGNTIIAYESDGATIRDVRLVDPRGIDCRVLEKGKRYRCTFKASFTQDCYSIRGAILFEALGGLRLGGTMTAPIGAGIRHVRPRDHCVFDFAFPCILNPGQYYLNVALFASTGGVEHALHGIQWAVKFRVAPVQANCDCIEAVDFGIAATATLIQSGNYAATPQP